MADIWDTFRKQKFFSRFSSFVPVIDYDCVFNRQQIWDGKSSITWNFPNIFNPYVTVATQQTF